MSNTASDFGGGLYLFYSPATLSGNKIVANKGDGLTHYSSSSSVYGNVVRANTGRGLFLSGDSSELVNNIVADNLGTGIYIANSSGSLLHTTIARNVGDGIYITGYSEDGCDVTCWHFYTPSHVKFYNTILVGHQVGVVTTRDSQTGLADTAVLEGTLWGNGAWANGTNWNSEGTIVTGTVNVFGNPDFVNPDAGNYHIGPNSAARDAGVNAGVATDIDGDARPDTCIFDIGADEFISSVKCIIHLPAILKDHP